MGGLATPFINHQHTNTMSTANHSVSKYRNQAQKLEEKQSCGAHQTDNGRVGWDHQIHTSRLPQMIRNHMFTRLYQLQAPCQLCLTTSLLATDGISHEGPRFFTLVRFSRKEPYLWHFCRFLIFDHNAYEASYTCTHACSGLFENALQPRNNRTVTPTGSFWKCSSPPPPHPLWPKLFDNGSERDSIFRTTEVRYQIFFCVWHGSGTFSVTGYGYCFQDYQQLSLRWILLPLHMLSRRRNW